MEFQGKTVIITGAGSGIGRATAVRFAQEGANLSVCALHTEGINETRRLCEEAGAKCLAIPVDVRVRGDVDACVRATLDAYGRIDVLVNNAGIPGGMHWPEITEVDWDEMIGIHLKGTFLFCHLVVPHMLAQGGGAIVNVASTSGITGGTSGPHYAAAKGGVIAFTKSLGRELAGQGIRTNAVIPSKIATRMMTFGFDAERDALLRKIPMHRLGQPDEIAEAILFLASDRASFITGETLVVSGGYP